MSRVLVTGAAGFVGSALVRGLRTRAYDVVATSSRSAAVATSDARDVLWLPWRCDEAGAATKFLRMIRAEAVDTVIHLAAIARPAIALQHPAAAFAVNLTGTASLLEAVRLAEGGVRHTVIASTAPLPDADPRRWQPYFVSKRGAEDLSLSYRQTYGMVASVVRLSTVYGPGDQDQGRLIPSVIADIRRGARLEIKEPDALVDLIYIDDIIEGILQALESPGVPVCDLSSGVLLRSIEVARLLKDLVEGIDSPSPPPVSPISDLRPPAGWAPAVSLRSGLARVAEAASPSQRADSTPVPCGQRS